MKTAEDKPNIIYLQDEDVNENYEGVTWCFHKIDDNDSKYIKVDHLISLIDKQIEPLQKYLDEVICTNEILVAKVKGSIEALTELKNRLACGKQVGE